MCQKIRLSNLRNFRNLHSSLFSKKGLLLLCTNFSSLAKSESKMKMVEPCERETIDTNPKTKTNPMPQLHIYNSLTRKKEAFTPKNSNQVLWYSCGPTVYDHAHLGHARAYTTFDIIRRVMTEFFGLNIRYVMNITDIDDKIIKRARQQHLFDQFLANLTQDGLKKHVENGLHILDLKAKSFNADQAANLQMVQKLIEKTNKLKISIDKIDPKSKQASKNLLKLAEDSKDAIMESLDSSPGGSDLESNEIYSKFARKFEESFFDDCKKLNIQLPDVITRVSEYVEEIVDYISQIEKNKYAYASNGSVYFDIDTFIKSESNSKTPHKYSKLLPENASNINLLNEGEGELTKKSSNGSEKRGQFDFALWKAKLPNQPSWPSPWGEGRPGWHIECSAMSHAILGTELDIHSGGCDLKFPHHDNEIAQCEAYSNSDSWTRYWMHTGHLHIEGLKMSKSLKNFISIKDALTQYSSNQIRMLFSMSKWSENLNFSARSLEEAQLVIKKFEEFFSTVKSLSQNSKYDTKLPYSKKPTKSDLKLYEQLALTRTKFYEALADNVDLRTGLDHLRALLTSSWVYISDNADLNHQLLNNIKSYFQEIFSKIGFTGRMAGCETENSLETSQMGNDLLQIIADFRNDVRIGAKAAKNWDLLKVCDKLRDETLPAKGVKMVDSANHGTLIKFEEEK